MPDDGQRAAQAKHASEIAATRVISAVTGVPFSQLRRATRQQEKAAKAEARAPLPPPRPVSETNPHLGPSPAPTSFPARPFAPAPVPGGGPVVPTDAPLGQELFIVDDNGTLKYFRFNASYDSDV